MSDEFTRWSCQRHNKAQHRTVRAAGPSQRWLGCGEVRPYPAAATRRTAPSESNASPTIVTLPVLIYNEKLFCLSNKWPYDLPNICETLTATEPIQKKRKTRKRKCEDSFTDLPSLPPLYFTFLGVCIAKLLAAHVSSFPKWWQLLPGRPGSNRNQTEVLRREKTPNATVFPSLLFTLIEAEA